MGSSFEKLTNSRLFAIGEVLWDLMVLSVLWVIFSLPVVTIGPASSALYFAVRRRFQLKEETPVKDFIRSFRLNLKQGIILSIIFLVYGSAVSFNIFFAFKGFGGITLPDWYLPFSLLLLIPILAVCPMTFPYLARFGNDIKHILLNSTLLSIMNTGRTLLIWFYLILAGALITFFPPSLLLVPAGFTFLIMRTAEKTFEGAIANENSRQTEETADGEASDNNE